MRKFSALILFVLLGIGAANAQAPEQKTEKQGAVRAMAFSFDSDGGYLGVRTEEISKDNFSKFGLGSVRGVAVESVVDGSPAQAAGLQKGDVIIRVNGDEITSGRKLSRLIGEISPDHPARITILRNGSEREITATLGKRPGAGSLELFGPAGRMELPGFGGLPELDRLPRMEVRPGEPAVRVFGSRRQIGVSLTPLTEQLADHYGVESGALISSVRENSPAAKAGLKAGDVIAEVDGKPVKSDVDLVRAITEKRDGSLTLAIVRDRSRQSVSVTPEEVKGVFNDLFEFTPPDAPNAPETFRMTAPPVPAAPLPPLNRLRLPGRVI